MYDTKCDDLAREFLSQFANGDAAPQAMIDKHAPQLAQAIQDCIESELADMAEYDVMRPERHPDEDDGRTYGDPRDEMAERLDRD